MAEYRTIRMAFWTDPYIEELETEAKLLYVYLFTSPHTNNLGILEATRRKIAYETGISIENINKHLVKFASAGKVVIDEEHNALLLTRFIKHQTSTSPKIAEGLKKLFPAIPSKRFADTLSALYPNIFNGCEYHIDTISIPYQTDADTISIPSAELERELERESEDKIHCASDDAPRADSPSKSCSRREETFVMFWDAFAYKKGKGGAEKAWQRIPRMNDELLDKILSAARKEAEQRPALIQAGRTPKMAEGWLNEKRWEDEYTPFPVHKYTDAELLGVN